MSVLPLLPKDIWIGDRKDQGLGIFVKKNIVATQLD
jgi:hypothetical protein